jgi:hypothetical protein
MAAEDLSIRVSKTIEQIDTEIGGDIGPVEIGPDEIGPANRTLRNRPTFKIFLKRSYFSVKVGLFLPIISKFHKVL